MHERILDFSEAAARLRVRDEQLVIEREDGSQITTPLAEAAVVVIAHPKISLTQAVLSGLMRHGGIVVTCDGSRMPCGMMLPIQTHVFQTKRFAAQARTALPIKKRLWQQIVRAKLRSQARLLERLRGGDGGLHELADRVRSGDPDNLESQGAQRYWPLLFNSGDFRRRTEAEDENRLLNYGYAVLRGVVSRAVCTAGLHPSLGLHHHNQYDAFCLADDLMEPFRSVVDRSVLEVVGKRGRDVELDRETKAALIGAILERYDSNGEKRTLFDLVSRTARSLACVFMGEAKRLEIPEI